MRFGRRTTLVSCLVALPYVATGCRTYVPLRDGAVSTAGGPVRVTLTDVGTVAVGSSLGPHVRTIDGRLISHGDSGVVIGVTQVTRTDGAEQSFGGDQVVLPPSAVQELGAVRTSVGRSLLLGGVIVAGAVLAAAGLGKGSGEGGPRGGGTPEPGK